MTILMGRPRPTHATAAGVRDAGWATATPVDASAATPMTTRAPTRNLQTHRLLVAVVFMPVRPHSTALTYSLLSEHLPQRHQPPRPQKVRTRTCPRTVNHSSGARTGRAAEEWLRGCAADGDRGRVVAGLCDRCFVYGPGLFTAALASNLAVQVLDWSCCGDRRRADRQRWCSWARPSLRRAAPPCRAGSSSKSWPSP